MKTLDQWFEEYGASHKNPTNKRIHWICVPMIFFSIICLFAAIPASYLANWAPAEWQPFLHWGTVLIALGLLFYLRLSPAMFLGILLFSLLCLFGVTLLDLLPLPLWASGSIIFVGAWLGQFIGHKIEGKKPSFFKDLQFLLIGPAWLMGFVYKKLGLSY